MLRLDGLTYRIAGRTILDGATAALATGARAGLVGRNGAGKTTLLRLVAGTLQADAGTIGVSRGARIGTVAQEAPSGQEALIDTVLAADTERSALLAEAETATEPLRIADIHTRLADIEAHVAPARAASILAGLGFDAAAQQGSCAALSGGWRMRVALAAALFARPDVLLLDEPTNHLDFESALWLESFVARYKGTVVLVSHDRGLLDRATDRTLHLEDGRLTAYTGNYSTFERTLRERRSLQTRSNEKMVAQRRRMMVFVDRFRAQANKARQVQSRLKALERLAPIVPIIESRSIALDFPDPKELPPPLITLAGVAAAYDGPPVLSHLDLRIDMDDRIALLGPNGNGKSTLMRLLAGRMEPAAGRITRASKLRIGYFAQHQMEELDPDATAYAHFARLEPNAPAHKLRAHLGRFGFTQDKADVVASQLSGGEKARLLLSLMSRATPHMLLLDEPTNHLDIESREALAQALNAFPGAVMLISHDPHLIELTADRLWLVEDGTCHPFDGDLEDYGRRVLERRRAQRNGRDENGKGVNRRDRRRASADARAAVVSLRRAAEKAEAKVAKLTEQIAAHELQLAETGFYDRPAAEIETVLRRGGELQGDLAAAEQAWLAAQEAYDAARD